MHTNCSLVSLIADPVSLSRLSKVCEFHHTRFDTDPPFGLLVASLVGLGQLAAEVIDLGGEVADLVLLGLVMVDLVLKRKKEMDSGKFNYYQSFIASV